MPDPDAPKQNSAEIDAGKDFSGANANAGIGRLASHPIKPALSHSIYTLIGFAWPVFGIIFLCLLCSTAWFVWPLPIWQLFLPACFLALASGHLLAIGLESAVATRALYFFRRGVPLIFYRRFAVLQVEAPTDSASPKLSKAPVGEPAIVFGERRIALQAVDELYLTFLGMLEIRSFAAAGRLRAGTGDAAKPLNRPDTLVRVPIGALGLLEQKELVATFKRYHTGITINNRLEERLRSPIVKGQAIISACGAVVLLYALFDVSYATFTWLEMLKNYYGSQLCARLPEKAEAFLAPSSSSAVAKSRAGELYDRAENLRLHPFPLSWAYRALFANGNSASQLVDIRAECLYRLGRTSEAIELLRNAIALKPNGFKTQLQLARYLAATGQSAQASTLMDQVLDKHKDVLLPRLYNLALLPASDKGGPAAMYSRYLEQLDEEVFGEEPAWPPGGEKPLMEMWRREDLEFLAQYLLHVAKLKI